ncbi:MAG: SGNH/GDSL hydrolase family protein [Oscillospiraceae bacterium]|nr:SGNH/GDSL hydrolase family protein [Oscillospiraceae bacterium]
MKKLLSIILCVGLLCGTFAVAAFSSNCPCTPEEDYYARPLMVVLGDSIAAGWGVAQHESAAAMFAQRHGYRRVNFAYAGNMSHRLRNAVTTNETMQDYVSRAEVILISIGGNDFMLAGSYGDLVGHVMDAMLQDDFSFMQPMLAALEENFAAIITQVRELNPDAVVIVQTMFNPAPALPSLYDAAGVAIAALNNVIRNQHALDPDAFVIACVHTAFAGRVGVAQLDLIHPNVRGHRVITQVLDDAYLGTQTEIPLSPWCTFSRTALRPVLWLVDVLVVRLGLRLLWPLLGGGVMWLVDAIVGRLIF